MAQRTLQGIILFLTLALTAGVLASFRQHTRVETGVEEAEQRKGAVTPPPEIITLPQPTPAMPQATAESSVALFTTPMVPGIDRALDFSAYVPGSWRAEMTSAKGLRFMEETTASGTRVRMLVHAQRAAAPGVSWPFTAARRSESAVAGLRANTFTATLLPKGKLAADDPAWRAAAHQTVVVRVTEGSPALFFSIARDPELSEGVFHAILETLTLNPSGLLVPPLSVFADLQPVLVFGAASASPTPIGTHPGEGLHAGADTVPPGAESPTATIPVRAVADGDIVAQGFAPGLGGYAVIRHVVPGETFIMMYGGLTQKTLPVVGKVVRAGMPFGELARAGTRDAGGGARRLHLGVWVGEGMPPISPWVSDGAALTNFRDPGPFLQERML